MRVKKIYMWIKSEKLNLSIASALFAINILSLVASLHWIITYRYITEFFSTLIFVVSIIFLFFMLIRDCKKRRSISLIYLISINTIAMFNFIGSSTMFFNIFLLWLRAIIFFTVVILGLVVVWKAKTKFAEKFNIYLIISLMTVILNFGGFYGSIYSMYSPYSLESFKIEQGMSFSQAVMPKDFIYYSADAFFGTDLSDVSLRYNDHSDLLDENNVASNHIDRYKEANITIDIVKMVSMVESILFILYISIIVLNAEGVKKKVGHNSFEKS